MNDSERIPPNLNATTFSSFASSWLFNDPGAYRAPLALALLTAALLVPFVGKAFHMDDTMFLKAARQITAYPFDPYGFSANWSYFDMPVAEVMKNPPLVSYYIAAVAAIIGWSEAALHLFFLPFAIAVVLGTYALARRCAAPPVFSALVCLISPVFLVSSTNVMCDTMMLSFYVWAIVLWIDGITRNSYPRLLVAGALVAMAVLTKYFAVSALPLMAAYAISRRRLTVVPLLAIAFPVSLIIGYELWTASLYGHGHLSEAVGYANMQRTWSVSRHWTKLVVGLGFAGAALPSMVLFAPKLFSRRLAAGAAVFALAAASFILWRAAQSGSSLIAWNSLPFLAAELALLIFAGLGIAAIGVSAVRRGSGPEAMLLGLWILGTAVFGSIINWSVNARVFMPLGPPAAVLIARLLAGRAVLAGRWIALTMIASAFLSLAVCWGDYRLAGSGRDAATLIMGQPRPKEAVVWFQGHWGFQHYMEKLGARAFDARMLNLAEGDLLVLPENNCNVSGLEAHYLSSIQRIDLPASRWVTTLSAGAGFYADIYGPLPFVLGPVPDERYFIAKFRRP